VGRGGPLRTVRSAVEVIGARDAREAEASSTRSASASCATLSDSAQPASSSSSAARVSCSAAALRHAPAPPPQRGWRLPLLRQAPAPPPGRPAPPPPRAARPRLRRRQGGGRPRLRQQHCLRAQCLQSLALRVGAGGGGLRSSTAARAARAPSCVSTTPARARWFAAAAGWAVPDRRGLTMIGSAACRPASESLSP
jgi:hypothetical protein